ncbi:MAG: chromosome segregation protein SMC [Acidobacteriales bacterium]|nr:chromosome segregation protein SMC [Terriglobales bacterium]
MLKLKKLQILGFKSFCDRTELKFHGEGIAAIIGPNGCGKSNIADAVSWVLGEQSAKTLRGSRMEDVIFAGTRDRKPTGMAEVSLTLIDPEVYAGSDLKEIPEIEIKNELPEEDWDEAQIRTTNTEEAERLTEEAQPGKTEEIEADQAPPGESPEASPHTEAREGSGPTVVLKIRRRKFQPQVRAGELQITRRLFRSGDSEYLLNGKLCRLRDIQELFMGTGLGPETYALIEQGRIGQILSSRPTDRRAILEEAAGITKFKTRKRLAEGRLEEAKLNLARVNDIFEEVTRQMNSLKRQAAKAERFAKLREEMRSKLRVVLVSKFAQFDLESTELDTQLNTLSEEIRSQAERVQEFEAEQEERTRRGYAIQTELTENRERLTQIKLESDRAQARRRNNEERCLELETRSSSFAAEILQSEQRLRALESEREGHQELLASAAQDVAAAQAELERSQRELAEASSALDSLERQQEASRGAVLQAVAAAAQSRNQLTQSNERLAGVERETQRLRAECDAAQAQLHTFGAQRGQFALQFESASQYLNALNQQASETRHISEVKRQQELECKAHLDTLRSEFASAMGKRSSLEALIAEHGYSTESVRRLFQSGGLQGGLAPVGVLADFLEVEPQYENVVEDFLREELNYVVVKSWDAADEGMRLLRSDVEGRATFLVHPDDSQAKFSFVVDENGRSSPASHPVLPLKDTIRVLDGFGKSLEVILPKLRDGYITPDPAMARGLALENPDAFFLSTSGECFHNVTVTGGKQRSEGPLSMKRELRDVMRTLNDLEAALREQETRALVLARELKDLSSLLDRLEQQAREADKNAMTSGHSLKQLESEMERVRQRLGTYEQELARLAGERNEQESLISERQAEIAAAEQRQRALEQDAMSAQANLATLRERRDQSAQEHSQQMVRVATLAERHRSAIVALERVQVSLAEAADRTRSLSSQRDSAATEQVRRQAENEQLATQVEEYAAERNVTEARDSLLQVESEQVRTRMAELAGQLHSLRQSLDIARDRRGQISATAAKLQSDMEYMAETCLNELGVARHELDLAAEIPTLSGEELATEDQHYHDLRARLDAMGPVNMMALEEYKESAERHDFLDVQRKDLLDSIQNTQATIKEIDAISREKFQEAFDRINENFQVTFKKLFGGGHAFMKLTDEENSADSGIDVVASPPGKKLQNVLLLSGGEKALTALSLLVGIFQYQPSPFCILDEVDAPLDEANIGRFTELVRDMSVKTQFVLITHSKKTMSIAPVMYGVTMQEPGVSKLVSVRFAEHEPASV